MIEIRIRVKSFNKLYIENFIKTAKQLSEYLKTVKLSSLVFLPTVQKKYTFLTSPHIDKKAREQMEKRGKGFNSL
jgi:ribosomal protein S10